MKDWTGVGDRRKFYRLRAALFVCFSLRDEFYIPRLAQGEEIEARTFDISQGGMAIATRYNIPAKARLDIKCLLLGVNKQGVVSFSRPLELNGEVRYNTPINGSEYRLGICFRQLSQEDKKQVDDYISCISRGELFPCVQPK